MIIVPIQEAKEELEHCSKNVTETLLDEYNKGDNNFRSMFTREQFGLILAIADTYARSLALELYNHVSNANSAEPSFQPSEHQSPAGHDPSIQQP